MDTAVELVVRLAVIQCLGKRLAGLYVRPDKKLYRRVNLSYHFTIRAVGYYITQQAGSLPCAPCQPLVTAALRCHNKTYKYIYSQFAAKAVRECKSILVEASVPNRFVTQPFEFVSQMQHAALQINDHQIIR
jgi:hypothetical protein